MFPALNPRMPIFMNEIDFVLRYFKHEEKCNSLQSGCMPY